MSEKLNQWYEYGIFYRPTVNVVGYEYDYDGISSCDGCEDDCGDCSINADENKKKDPNKKCTCSMDLLMLQGCQCGGK